MEMNQRIGNGQLSVVRCPLSVVRCQLSVVSWRANATNDGRRTTDNYLLNALNACSIGGGLLRPAATCGSVRWRRTAWPSCRLPTELMTTTSPVFTPDTI